MPFVTMTCPTLDLNRKSTKLGRFIIKNGKHQQHRITFSFPGYKKVTVTVTVTKGILAKIEVVMEAIETEI